MKILSLFGGSTKHKSLVVTAQRRLNCYYENRPDQDKAKVVIYGTPGLVQYLNYGAAATPTAPASETVSSIVDQFDSGTYSESVFSVAAASDPTRTAFTSLNVNGVTRLSSSASYQYADGIAYWIWNNASFGFAAGSTYTLTFAGSSYGPIMFTAGVLSQRAPGGAGVIVDYGYQLSPAIGSINAALVPNGFQGPARGILGTTLVNSSINGLFFVVGDQIISQVPNTQNLIFTPAVLQTSAGLVSMAYRPGQMVIVDGRQGYLVTFSTTLNATVIASFPATGAKTITFCSDFFVAEQPGTQQFWVSNFNDGSTWNALAFASASAYSDNIVAVDSVLGNLIPFGQYHTEFWQNVGNTPQPFAPLLSAVSEYGLAAIFSRAHVDQTIIFLAQTRSGAVQAAQIVGYNINIISDADVESIWNSFSVTSDAVALTYQRDTHKFYQLTFPTANRSFLFDCSTRLWGDAQTGTTTGRHTANLSTVFNGETILSDYAQGLLYSQSDTVYTDNLTPIVREIVTRHVLSNFNRVRPSLLYVDMETGVGLQTGQGSAPMVMLQHSRDNGRTWSGERWSSLGQAGNYLARVSWRRFGSARDHVWKLRMSDPVKFVITEGAIKIAEREPAAKSG